MFQLLPYNKAKRFTNTSIEENEQGFIESQLNDMRYMSKKAKEILTEICDKNNIIPLAGAVTSELRHLWGLNNILQPVKVLNLKGVIVDKKKAIRHWVVFNEKEEAQYFIPQFNDKPKLENNQTTYSGKLEKGNWDDQRLRSSGAGRTSTKKNARNHRSPRKDHGIRDCW